MKISKVFLVEQGLPWHIEDGVMVPSDVSVHYALTSDMARLLEWTDRFSYGTALELLMLGAKVKRDGWNENDMWIAYMSGMKLPAYNNSNAQRRVNDRTKDLVGADTAVTLAPYISLWAATGTLQPGWLPSQADQFAADWLLAGAQVPGKRFYLLDFGTDTIGINAKTGTSTEG